MSTNMDDDRPIRVAKNTQKFVKDLADLNHRDYEKVMDLLEALEKQQATEAHLENKRGWRYLWQRTPKPYLLMMAYLVFLAPVGSVGYHALTYFPEAYKALYISILAGILILPLGVVFFLSYHYIKQRIKEEKEEDKDE